MGREWEPPWQICQGSGMRQPPPSPPSSRDPTTTGLSGSRWETESSFAIGSQLNGTERSWAIRSLPLQYQHRGDWAAAWCFQQEEDNASNKRKETLEVHVRCVGFGDDD